MAGELAKRVGERVRAHRKAEGIGQEAFAQNLGMHRTWIGAVERGERNLTLGSIERLAEEMGIEPMDLLREDPRRPYPSRPARPT